MKKLVTSEDSSSNYKFFLTLNKIKRKLIKNIKYNFFYEKYISFFVLYK